MKRANEEREQDRDRQRRLQQGDSGGRHKTPSTLPRTVPTSDMTLQQGIALENLRQNLSFSEGDGVSLLFFLNVNLDDCNESENILIYIALWQSTTFNHQNYLA